MLVFKVGKIPCKHLSPKKPPSSYVVCELGFNRNKNPLRNTFLMGMMIAIFFRLATKRKVCRAARHPPPQRLTMTHKSFFDKRVDFLSLMGDQYVFTARSLMLQRVLFYQTRRQKMRSKTAFGSELLSHLSNKANPCCLWHMVI